MPFGRHQEPGQTKYEWIEDLSEDTQNYMLRLTAQAAGNYNGRTDQAKIDIGQQFSLNSQEVKEVTNWVYSHKVDDSREHQYSYYARQSTSGTQDEPDEPEIPDNPALGPSRGAAYDAGIEPYEHVQTVTMGDRNPTTVPFLKKWALRCTGVTFPALAG